MEENISVSMKEQNNDQAIIENNEKWFNFYVKLPKIVAMITAVLFFIWGIVDAVAFKQPIYTYYTYPYYRTEIVGYSYGVMCLPNAFLSLLVWWAIGAAVCASTYFILKLATCYPILQIYNLKQIRENTKKD